MPLTGVGNARGGKLLGTLCLRCQCWLWVGFRLWPAVCMALDSKPKGDVTPTPMSVRGSVCSRVATMQTHSDRQLRGFCSTGHLSEESGQGLAGLESVSADPGRQHLPPSMQGPLEGSGEAGELVPCILGRDIQREGSGQLPESPRWE